MNEHSPLTPPDPAPEPVPDHYIETTTSLVERVLRTLKEGDAFAVLDRYGDMGTDPASPEGLFFRDTRYLSRYSLRIQGLRPLLLGSSLQDDNAALTVDLTNPDIDPAEPHGLPRDLIAIERTKFLWDGACYERIGFRNYDNRRRGFDIDLTFDADFHDLFEARGTHRERHGQRSAVVLGPDRVEFRYVGLDHVVRHTCLQFEPAPAMLDVNRARFRIELEAGARCSIIAVVSCREGERAEPVNFLSAF
jgi:glycogen debranching enzyme